LEAPAASGKTSLGQMLQLFDGFRVINKQSLADDVTQNDLRRRVFVDEAQLLNLREIELLRGVGDDPIGNVIVCAGVSRHPTPHCPRCQSCDLCRTCLKHRCGHLNDDCTHQQWIDTLSMVICDSPSRRFTVDELRVEAAEVTTFLELFLGSDSKPTFTGDPGELAKEMTTALMEQTGGAAGLLVHILREFFTGQNPVFKGRELTAADFSKALLTQDTFKRVQELRLAVHFADYDKAASDALLKFMRTGREPDDAEFETLQKKALLRRDEASRRIVPWSPLVHDVLWFKLFAAKDHEACPFSTVEEMVRFLVGKLAHTEFKDWVLNSDGKLEHEDSVNGAIAWLLKSHLPKGARHVGPAKKSTAQVYMQVDHEIRWGDGKLWLLETCLKNPAEHCDRFDAEKGTYTAYRFSEGVVLWISDTNEPRSCVNVPSSCAAFHVSAPLFKIRKWDVDRQQWCDV
jgi:hypothetical protein